MALVRAGLDAFDNLRPGRARTEVVVLVDYDTLIERAGGTVRTGSGAPLTGEQARRLCCDANIRRLVVKGGSQLLDVGARTPSFTPAQRAAMFARDRGCRFPGCGRWWGVEAHHLHHWAEVGPTAATNGAYLCRPHHRLLHEGRWRVTGHPDDTLWYHPPLGLPPVPSDPPGRRTLAGEMRAPAAA